MTLGSCVISIQVKVNLAQLYTDTTKIDDYIEKSSSLNSIIKNQYLKFLSKPITRDSDGT